jgi:hypothetical protein
MDSALISQTGFTFLYVSPGKIHSSADWIDYSLLLLPLELRYSAGRRSLWTVWVLACKDLRLKGNWVAGEEEV